MRAGAADNQIFAENSWYFRNALVRANYTDLTRGIHEDTRPLERFLENLLMGTDHPLQNRTLHIRWAEKPDIQPAKPDIEAEKPDIHRLYGEQLEAMTARTAEHVQALCERFGTAGIFGRTDLISLTGLKPARASELLKDLTARGILQPVSGKGKGKVRLANTD